MSEGTPAFRLAPFEAWHLTRLSPRTFERQEMGALDDTLERGAAYAAAGPAFTGLLGEDVAFCAGAIELWPGVGEAWSVTSDLVERTPVSFHRSIHRLLEQQQRQHGCHRLQTAVRQDHRTSIRWLHRLGFVYEGRMDRYGPDGSPYLRFARFLDEGGIKARLPDAVPDGVAVGMMD